MRREGFELSISQPRVILRELEDGKTYEPFEEVTIDCDEEHSGTVIEKMNIRNAELRDLQVSDDGIFLGALGALAELLAGVDDGLLRPLHRLLECLLVGTGRGELLGEADNLCKQNMTSVQLPVHTLK